MTAHAWQNLAVAVALAGGWRLWRAAARRDDWREAWRRLRADRLAMISLFSVLAYVAIGLLDCVSWRDRARHPDGSVVTGEGGETVRDPNPRTILDRLCAPLTARQEKTYSAPFAAVQFTKETRAGPDGRIIRAAPPLRHPRSHPFGTDRTGTDVLYLTLKGARTALLIGGLATLIVIPLALALGLAAGYRGRRVDDAVQFTYTTLASIPDILLIAAFMLIFGRGLPQLCIILGITSWTGLCRLLRGEALRLRELEFVQAARALGVPGWRIVARHLAPNVAHLVLISFVLRFSDLVLTEAVLSYLGIGVEPGTGSWGHMINAARQELTRDPAVWWNLAAAFVAMLGLVLPVNLLGDALRDALDPKLRDR